MGPDKVEDGSTGSPLGSAIVDLCGLRPLLESRLTPVFLDA